MVDISTEVPWCVLDPEKDDLCSFLYLYVLWKKKLLNSVCFHVDAKPFNGTRTVTEVAHLVMAQHDLRLYIVMSVADFYWYKYFRIHWVCLDAALASITVTTVIHMTKWKAFPWNFPMGSLMALSLKGTKTSTCAAVIEGLGLETKKMTTDERWAFIHMVFNSDHYNETFLYKLLWKACSDPHLKV